MTARSSIYFLALFALISCSRVISNDTIHKNQLREWTDTEKKNTETAFTEVKAYGTQITGKLVQTEYCVDTTYSENSRTLVKERKPRKLWIDLLAGAASTAIGVAYLAAAPGKSDETTATDETSDQKEAYIVGATLTGIGAVFLGHAGYSAIRSIDKEEKLDNETEEVKHSEVYKCNAQGVANATVNILAPSLGIETAVSAGTTDNEGNFSIQLDNIDGFQFPADTHAEREITLRANGMEFFLNTPGSITDGFADIKRQCRDYTSCIEVYETLQKESNAQKQDITKWIYRQIHDFAERNEDDCRKFVKHFDDLPVAVFSSGNTMAARCDFLKLKKNPTLRNLKAALKKSSLSSFKDELENLAYEQVTQSNKLPDYEWFLETFPHSTYSTEIEAQILSIKYNGIPANLLRCCNNDSMTVLDVIENEKKGWSITLAVEQIKQSSAKFKQFSANEIEILRKAGVRDQVIEAMLKKQSDSNPPQQQQVYVPQYEPRKNAYVITVSCGSIFYSPSKTYRVFAEDIMTAEIIAMDKLDDDVGCGDSRINIDSSRRVD